MVDSDISRAYNVRDTDADQQDSDEGTGSRARKSIYSDITRSYPARATTADLQSSASGSIEPTTTSRTSMLSDKISNPLMKLIKTSTNSSGSKSAPMTQVKSWREATDRRSLIVTQIAKSTTRLRFKASRWEEWNNYLSSVQAELICCSLPFFELVLLLHEVTNSDSANDFHWMKYARLALLGLMSLEIVGRVLLMLSSGKSCWKTQSLRGLQHRLQGDVVLLCLSAVLCILLGLSSRVAVLPRALRIFHLASAGKHCYFFRPLHVMIATVVQSIGVLCFGLVSYLMIMLTFSIVGMELLKPEIEKKFDEDSLQRFGANTVEDCKYAFSGLQPSLTTLFSLCMGDQWHDVAFPIIYHIPSALPYFMAYVCAVGVVMVGTFYGALHENQINWGRGRGWFATVEKKKEKTQTKEWLERLFKDLDVDNSGKITWQEFYYNQRYDIRFQQLMMMKDIEEEELHELWNMLDVDGDGDVSCQEFLDLLQRLESGEIKWPLLRTAHVTSRLCSTIDKNHKQISKDLSSLQSDLSRQRELMQEIQEEFETIRERYPCSQDSGPHSREKSMEDVPIIQRKESQESIRSMDSQICLSLTNRFMRGVRAEQVVHYTKQDVLDFWGTSTIIDVANDTEFQMSRPVSHCDYFISHCWKAPEDWHKHFKPERTVDMYEYKKTVELNSVFKGLERREEGRFAGHNGLSVDDIIVWIDKCCIPQHDKHVRDTCVAIIEGFMKKSSGLVVLMSWNYFSRLWCIYEWACFLRLHHPMRVEIGIDTFLKTYPEETLHLYLDAIEKLSVQGAVCCNPSDHKILEEKVFQYYMGETREESFESFETFARVSALTLIAKQIILWRGRGSENDEAAWLNPLRSLADKLGYQDLQSVLEFAQPARWWSLCKRDPDAYNTIVRYWFENVAVQYLLEEKGRLVREDVEETKTARKKKSPAGRASRSQRMSSFNRAADFQASTEVQSEMDEVCAGLDVDVVKALNAEFELAKTMTKRLSVRNKRRTLSQANLPEAHYLMNRRLSRDSSEPVRSLSAGPIIGNLILPSLPSGQLFQEEDSLGTPDWMVAPEGDVGVPLVFSPPHLPPKQTGIFDDHPQMDDDDVQPVRNLR